MFEKLMVAVDLFEGRGAFVRCLGGLARLDDNLRLRALCRIVPPGEHAVHPRHVRGTEARLTIS